MASAIVVEDGTGVDGANSYVTGSQVVDYAAQRGFSLENNDTLLLPFVVAATDFLESLADRYIGRLRFSGGLSWPRYSVFIDYALVVGIPTQLVKAQCQLVVEQLRGISLNSSSGGTGGVASSFPSPLTGGAAIKVSDPRFAIRERLEGVVDKQYSENIGTGLLPYLPLVNAALKPLLTSTPGQINIGRG